MIQTILVGLDGSDLAERALPYAAALARVTNGILTLVQVVPAHPTGPTLQDDNPHLIPFMAAVPVAAPGAEGETARNELHEAERYLDGVASRLAAEGTRCETVIARGEPSRALIEEAASRRADLVVLSTHGRSGLGRWLFGSVAEAVMARSDVPVLLARAAQPEAPVRLPGPGTPILVPLDGSELAERALPVATELAERFGAELRLVNVIVPTPELSAADKVALDDVVRGLSDEGEAVAREYLARQEAKLQGTGLTIHSAVRVDTSAAGIVAVGEEVGAGLVVMTTRAPTGLARAFAGSVALGVLHGGRIPVVFVPARPASG
jgi:nucleotide-binding universal stress UspA family protein